MQDILNQIRLANKNGLYYVGLFAALAIPDICGALESVDGMANQNKYIDWFDTNMPLYYRGYMSGQDAYYFRCSMLHQGTTQHTKSSYSRVLFIEPGASSNIFHMNILHDALNIDVQIFISEIIVAAERWLGNVQQTDLFQANWSRFVKRYSQGLAPYIGGVAVIA